jgi:hypothetical protein
MEQTKKFLLNGKLYTASEYCRAYNNEGRSKINYISSNSYNSYGSSGSSGSPRSTYSSSTSSSGSNVPFDVNKIGASWVKVGSGAYY